MSNKRIHRPTELMLCNYSEVGSGDADAEAAAA